MSQRPTIGTIRYRAGVAFQRYLERRPDLRADVELLDPETARFMAASFAAGYAERVVEEHKEDNNQ